jgi:glycosyltransferase involved in cell wall biosynthesis
MFMKPPGRDGQRIRSGSSLRSTLRAVIPFGVRRPLLNLLRPRHETELSAAHCEFGESGRYDIICYPIIDWNYLFQRPQQLMRQFALNRRRVFYLHTTFHQSDRIAYVRQPSDRINIVRLPGPRGINSLYESEMTAAEIEKALDGLDQLRYYAGIETAVSVVQLPSWTKLARRARQEWDWRIVYDCMDEHSGFAGAPAHLVSLEAELFECSDLVVASSRTLYEKAASKRPGVMMLPNAADFAHFSENRIGDPLSRINRPIVGYYGAISDWFDLEMVRQAAGARPKWQFVLVGDAFATDLDAIGRTPNIHLIAARPYSELPAFLHSFDVAIIPFKRTPLTDATNPVKLYEYLSAGKPVVATRLPELESHREYLYLAESAGDFVNQIEAALAEPPDKKTARITFARANTWAERFATLDDAIRRKVIGLVDPNLAQGVE